MVCSPFPMPPMQSLTKLLSIANALRPYASLFDPRSFRSFKAVVEVLLYHHHGKQPEFAVKAQKSLAAIQYFFRYAHWSADEVNGMRLSVIRNRRGTEDTVDDILIFDGSPIAKDKNCKSEGISRLWDNRKKAVVTGYELLGAAILTRTGITYPLRLLLYIPEKWLSEWHAWNALLRWCVARSSAWLVVVDRGFRNSHFLAAILRRKREFLVRATITMPVWAKTQRKQTAKARGRKQRFPTREKKAVQHYCTDDTVIRTQKGKLWFLPNVIVDAWKNEVGRCCSVIVYHQNGFRDPLVIVFSRKDITMEKALELVGIYHKRWKIETCFLELKTSFQLEGFRLTSIDAIEKWLCVCLVAHSVLQAMHHAMQPDAALARFIAYILKKRRNIKERTLLNLKIFLEMCHSTLYGLMREFSYFLANIFPCMS